MNVLTIGRDKDKKLFEEGSAIRARVRAYGEKMEGLHITVFTLKKDGLKKIQISPNVFVYPTNSISRWFFLRDAIMLGKKIIVEEKFVRGDAVVSAQDPFECGFVGWRISRAFRLPLHIQIHTDFLSPYFKTSFFQRLRVMMARFLLPKASGVRVVSRRIADSISRKNIKLQIAPQILPIRVDAESFTTLSSKDTLRVQFPQFKFIVLMASRLSKEKRIQDAIYAFRKIALNNTFAGLIIAGDGSERTYLERLRNKLELTHHVIFLGPQNDVFALMKSANCFLSTSEFEGYGMSIIEAGLAHLPVVATNAGVAGEILVDGVNALLVPVGDRMAIVRHIETLISNNALREILSQRLESDIQALIPTKEDYVAQYVQGIADILKKTNL